MDVVPSSQRLTQRWRCSTRSPTFGSIRFVRRAARGAAPRQLGDASRQALAHLGHGGEDRLDQRAQDVERADLVRSCTADRGDRLGVQRRAVGRDPLEDQATSLKGLVEAAEERLDVALTRVAAEDLVAKPLERPVVDDREDAERAIIQLGGGDGAREVG